MSTTSDKQSSDEMERKWYEKFTYVSIAIAGISIFLLSIYWFSQEFLNKSIANSLIIFIAKEAGMAGLIALILNISIEWLNRRKHEDHQNSLLTKLEEKHKETSEKLLNNVNKQLFKTVYERNIDPIVFKQVEDHLLKAEIMRRDFEASFKISPFKTDVSQDTDFVIISFYNKFSLHNISSEDITVDAVIGMVDVTPKYKENCYFQSAAIDSITYTKQGLIDEGFVQQDKARDFISIKIPYKIPANDSIQVTLEYVKLAPKDYSEIIITTIPMDGLTLEVCDPAEMFTIEAVSLHPEPEKLVTLPNNKFLKRWKIPHAILPGQGIVMMWHPSNT